MFETKLLILFYTEDHACLLFYTECVPLRDDVCIRSFVLEGHNSLQ